MQSPDLLVPSATRVRASVWQHLVRAEVTSGGALACTCAHPPAPDFCVDAEAYVSLSFFFFFSLPWRPGLHATGFSSLLPHSPLCADSQRDLPVFLFLSAALKSFFYLFAARWLSWKKRKRRDDGGGELFSSTFHKMMTWLLSLDHASSPLSPFFFFFFFLFPLPPPRTLPYPPVFPTFAKMRIIW